MINSVHEKAELPARYSGAKYEHVPDNVKQVFKRMGETRKGLYLFGECGVGKTHVAYGLMQHCIENKIRAKMYKSTELLDLIRDYYGRKGLDYSDNELKKLMDYKGLLVIDDIGVEKPTEWVGETFYKIIDQRYEERLITIFTSNLDLNKLAERVGDRIPSRIAEMCEVVKLEGEDRRL